MICTTAFERDGIAWLVAARRSVYAELMRNIYTVGLIALLSVTHAQAEVYRWKDADGNVVYSDTPKPGAEEVTISEPTIVPSYRPRPTTATQTSTSATDGKPYDQLQINQPANEETFRNVTNVNVSVAARPALQQSIGHALQLLYDGQVLGEPGSQTSYQLADVERGAHTLQAEIIDASGKSLIRSPITTFFVHKTSVKRAP